MRIIKTIIRINDEISALLLHSNINHDIIKDLNAQLDKKLNSNFTIVKTNVSIAVDVTLEFIWTLINYYRILTPIQYLPQTLGKEIGMMKEGKTIVEAYFLGIKQYGYKYLENNQLIERSTEYHYRYLKISQRWQNNERNTYTIF